MGVIIASLSSFPAFDHLPYIGRSPTRSKEIYVGTGLAGWGMSNSTAAAIFITMARSSRLTDRLFRARAAETGAGLSLLAVRGNRGEGRVMDAHAFDCPGPSAVAASLQAVGDVRGVS